MTDRSSPPPSRGAVLDPGEAAAAGRELWPPALGAAVEIALGWPEPMAVVWSDPAICVGNAAYAALLGRGGKPFAEPIEGAPSPLLSRKDFASVVAGGEALEGWGRPLPSALETSGEPRRYSFVAAPLRDGQGAVKGVLQRAWLHTDDGAGVDAVALQHRVRNILASVRSIIRRSERDDMVLADFTSHLDGRLTALGRIHAQLARTPEQGADLEAIVRAELLAQGVEQDRVPVQGPPVSLRATAAEVMALAIHELATNATKFGALRQPGATTAVSWSVEARGDAPALVFRWAEKGVSMLINAPRRSGFGTELLTRRIAYELAGTATLGFRPGGVEAVIEIPLRDAAWTA